MTSPTQFILVDFENVHAIDLSPIGGKPVHVALFIGSKQTKMAIELVIQVHTFAAQVSLIQVGASGRNALDLTLASHLGRQIEQHPEGHFAIVSMDHDFDAMIAHWHSQGIKISRHGAFDTVPFLREPSKSAKGIGPKATPAAGPTSQTLQNRRAKAMARLADPASKNRPSSRKALTSHLKTTMGKDTDDAAIDIMISDLVEQKVLSIDERGKVSYTK